MASCKICQKESRLISSWLGLCLDCIRKDFKKASFFIEAAHKKSRQEFALPFMPPKDLKGRACNLCVNRCRIKEGQMGFCGLRQNVDGKLKGPDAREANLSFYYDSLPTNCVADWVCSGSTGRGYPDFAYTDGPEYGYKNLAVFYNGCSFNCLFCQNWHYRDALRSPNRIQAEDLAQRLDSRTSCICYFGGDPACQLPHSILTSRLALKNKKKRILRICWETNGSMNPNLLESIAKISLASGGCIKFDLKAFSEELNIALCGVSNRLTLENFKRLAQFTNLREEPPFLIASTLLVCGYVDECEVEKIARFIAKLNPRIPYSLLAFYPCFYMNDLPTTSKRHAQACLEVAKGCGLQNVRVGNIHLLSETY